MPQILDLKENGVLLVVADIESIRRALEQRARIMAFDHVHPFRHNPHPNICLELGEYTDSKENRSLRWCEYDFSTGFVDDESSGKPRRL